MELLCTIRSHIQIPTKLKKQYVISTYLSNSLTDRVQTQANPNTTVIQKSNLFRMKTHNGQCKTDKTQQKIRKIKEGHNQINKTIHPYSINDIKKKKNIST